MQITIDRVEENYAIAEYTDAAGSEQFAKIERVLLPGVKEGDVVDLVVNRTETQARKDKIRKLMDDLFEGE